MIVATGIFGALNRAESIAKGDNRIEELAEITYLRGSLFFPLGNFDGCLEQHELSRRYAQQAGSAEQEARALSGLGDAHYLRGRMITAYAQYKRCVEHCQRNGLEAIEVASIAMRGRTRLYQNDLQGALDDATTGANKGEQIGQHRAEMVARNNSAFTLIDMGRTADAKVECGRSLALARRLGAGRFEASNLKLLATIFVAEGDRARALALIEQAYTVSKKTGLTFNGPIVLGTLALATDNSDQRADALRHGLDIIEQGCVGHNYIGFYRDAMEVSLEQSDWDGVDRYADALESYTRAETLPYTQFFIARGRALSLFGRDQANDSTRHELERLRSEAERVGLRSALPVLEAALSSN